MEDMQVVGVKLWDKNNQNCVLGRRRPRSYLFTLCLDISVSHLQANEKLLTCFINHYFFIFHRLIGNFHFTSPLFSS